MEYHMTGRLGRIVKSLISHGFEAHLENVFYDSVEFLKMNKKQQAKYVEVVIQRLEYCVGIKNAKKILSSCGKQCCGKAWTSFIEDIFNSSESMDDFFILLNKKEKEYNTDFAFDSENNIISINRSKCICGLVEKAKYKYESGLYCECSTGHFKEFFEVVFVVEDIELEQSILTGSDSCKWKVKVRKK